MTHMSNRDRIARAAEEAKAAATEKAAKKATKKSPASRPDRAAKSVRMKVVWEVRNHTGKAVKTFAYPDKALAEAAVDALTKSTGHTHVLRDAKVPME
jgi:alkaline phosphatase